ncbi:MAG: carboxypeptidase regulatory-like domain-containing protein [Acidobacteriota bacterium]|nr:carboxypeptidase regulatory-like domain-containing protein [Acidobacteriota bacterium]
MRLKVLFGILSLCVALATPAAAQQTGSINGKVVDTGGAVLPGVTVEARSDVLPGPRVTVTDGNGEFRLPALPPGNYTIRFELAGMQVVTREALVQLAQDTVADATLGVAGVAENVTVTAVASLVERDSASIKSSVSNEQIMALPVGQEYRDLIKLIPGVQFTQDAVRGPSAGGSGQDNVYQFDGVNVTLPLFGTLSAEPASHDIAQVTTVKAGARAVDFDRSGGFTIDSVSKSGTNRYTGEIGYQFQTDQMAAPLKSGTLSTFEQDRTWTTASVGGPILPSRLNFYGSYYRPERTRENRANLYGDLPPYRSTRNEAFGKLTLTPLNSILLNFSFRDSHRLDRSDLFASSAAATTGTGAENRQKIGTAEGSWVINGRSHATFKYTHFGLKTQGRPDRVATTSISLDPGTRLDINNLDDLGLLSVPAPVAGQTTYNAFIQPLIDRYGYVQAGTRVGGGTVGFGTLFDNDDFFRDSGQIGYNLVLGSTVSHEIHVGYQRYTDSEDLTRSSNGWGSITVPGGRLAPPAGTTQPAFYTAAFQQQGLRGVPPTIHSEYRSQSIELNDTLRWKRLTFNAGVLASNDTLYGQGLQEDRSALSGFVLATGSTIKSRQYRMYEIPFSKLIQPRIGATWAYNGSDTVFASYARYNPAASSLPRAASWDRNLATTIQAHFDAAGVLFATTPVASSSGKLFDDDLTPRTVNEYLVGTARQLTDRWSGRLYGRYREGDHFWEDTNNNARIAFNPPTGIPRELYIPDLAAKVAQIGSGSSFVIAELDGAFTRFYEATLESEWRSSRAFVRGSYTWSRYHGNFDQDNTTGGINDMNTFIGSSNLGDDAGRQLWDNKEGRLRGDRPHMLKVYGYYGLPWNATAGAYAIAQSGQPWEAQSYEPYIALTTNTSDSNRYAEPAGSRRTASHWQIDLNYTQNVRLHERLNFQIVGDLFNVFDRQTGFDIQPAVHSATFGVPRQYFAPRRFQLAARLRF